jgi:hypothetical protein
MQSSACVRPLVTSIGRAELLPPGSSSTHLAAVALPTVAMAADAEDDVTPTTVTVSEHNPGHGHPSFPSRYTRGRMMRAPAAPMMLRCLLRQMFRKPRFQMIDDTNTFGACAFLQIQP